MSISRRLLLSLLFIRPAQSAPLRVAVLETFEINDKIAAILVNHAEPSERAPLAKWLQAHPRSSARLRNAAGQETAVTVFRVRMCFGRGLILLNQPMAIREGEILTLIT
jgi:hypothetical protein